ncbi:LPXTG cell wall anchor domain-containing protein [Yinghuangia seranimata]|uniref:LPXTG cell wall anchor domain-containing protein n=1 Tax=Yinghuangia seranimata TaxID=408067 RepID=UPI00248CB2C2|nr:LPXTG cell wall anchor domain-containing protein [Yinghuangia seranimata]MDI2125212.1 LPXTG cell wall anchor domain-containing protein [Yinghuangia seranimata]
MGALSAGLLLVAGAGESASASSAPRSLPRTGFAAALAAVIGVALIVAGVLTVIATRRRETFDDSDD